MLSFDFLERVWQELLHHILCIIFEEKYLSCYILLTYQISLSDCLELLRYWTIVYCNGFFSQVATSYMLKLT